MRVVCFGHFVYDAHHTHHNCDFNLQIEGNGVSL